METNSRSTPKAVKLPMTARLALGVIAVTLTTAVWWVLRNYSDPLPDFLLGVLAIGALLCAMLAVIGRLPSGFEVGGIEMSFEQDELSDLIDTVRSFLNDEPEARDRILDMIAAGTGSRAFRAAENWSETRDSGNVDVAGNSQRTGPSTTRTPSPHPLVDPLTTIRQELKTLAPGETIEEEYDVPSAGKGKAPRFDFYVRNEDLGVAVEFERYWNNTTVDLVSRKVARALRKGTPIDRVVVVTHPEGVPVYEDMRGDDDQIVVMSIAEFTAESLRSRLSGHAQWPAVEVD